MKPTSGRNGAPGTTTSEPIGGAEFRYIETSGLLAAILEDDVVAKESIRGEGRRVASALTLAEARRAVIRLTTTKRITADEGRSAILRLKRIQERLEIIEIGSDVLERVGRHFPVEPLRALDAIHLSTAERLDASPPLVTIVTRDQRVRDNARALGFMIE